MTAHPYQYIDTFVGFRELCRRVRDSDRVALDTEFVGEETFTPRLELIQVAVGEHRAVIDVPAVGTLEGFDVILSNPGIEKVVHAGRQDLELFQQHVGAMTASIFDTQVAAAMVGYGTQISYAQLVQRVIGRRLEKSHTLTNWSQRPLTAEQIAYALDDVAYLFSVHDHLKDRLRALGRVEWVQEEFARLQTAPQDEARDPRKRFQRLRGWDGLKPRHAAVLRELAAWREGEAKRRNVPRGRVLRDEALLELARRPPESLAAMRAMRGLPQSEVGRNGETLLAIIRDALASPQADWPVVPRQRKPDPEADGVVELLQAVLKARALEERIAPTLLATAADLQALVEGWRGGTIPDLPIVSGWRRALAGEDLLRMLEGRLRAGVDPSSGKVRFEA